MIVGAKAPSAPLGGSPVVLAEQGALEPLNLHGPINGNNCLKKKIHFVLTHLKWICF